MPATHARNSFASIAALILGASAACQGSQTAAPPGPLAHGDGPAPPPPATSPTYTPPPPDDAAHDGFAAPPPATPAPAAMGPISAALQQVPAAVSETYVFALSADRSELTIDPRPRPTRRAARDIGGFSSRDSENGGKVITLAGGPFRGAAWVRGSFRERVQASAQLAELGRAGYDLDQARDLLIVDGERDTSPTVFAFSADPRKPGIVGVCSQITVLDFGAGPRQPVAVRKPVVYLYPEAPTRVRVRVDIDGEFLAVYPRMGADGWSVLAAPDGELVDEATGRHHRYLFWEGTSAGFEIDPSRAHCVPGAEAAQFLENVCARFALSDPECGDLITYWIPTLAANPYNVIEFVDEAIYGRYARMRVEPEPDTVIRPFMIFRRSAVPVAVGAPPLPQRTRRGFTVVEWGGADLDAPPPTADRPR